MTIALNSALYFFFTLNTAVHVSEGNYSMAVFFGGIAMFLLVLLILLGVSDILDKHEEKAQGEEKHK